MPGRRPNEDGLDLPESWGLSAHRAPKPPNELATFQSTSAAMPSLRLFTSVMYHHLTNFSYTGSAE